MLNQTILTGNLGNDPEINFYGEGIPVASFSLAFRSTKKRTGWIKVTAFNKLAEVADRHLHKGARVAVVGSLDQQRWDGEDGQTRTSYSLIANSIEFIKTDGRGFESGAGEDGVPF